MSMDALSNGPLEPDNKRELCPDSGGPRYGAAIDHRLIVIETRFDTILPTLATKEDLAHVRLEVQRMFFALQDKLAADKNKV